MYIYSCINRDIAFRIMSLIEMNHTNVWQLKRKQCNSFIDTLSSRPIYKWQFPHNFRQMTLTTECRPPYSEETTASHQDRSYMLPWRNFGCWQKLIAKIYIQFIQVVIFERGLHIFKRQNISFKSTYTGPTIPDATKYRVYYLNLSGRGCICLHLSFFIQYIYLKWLR